METVQHVEIVECPLVLLHNKLVIVTRKYRKGIPHKFCCMCNQKMEDKQCKYFCTQKCYTRYRLGINVDYSKIVCRYPRIVQEEEEGGREDKYIRGFIDYSKDYFCRSCQIRVPQSEGLRCPECNRQIHTRKKNKLRGEVIDTRIRIDRL